MNTDLWVGAVATLAGAGLGGSISYLQSRQQIKDARAQRTEEAQRDKQRRSIERRFDAYANFLTHARRYRNAIRPYRLESVPGMTIQEIDALAAAADAASSLVFLLNESQTAFEACRDAVRTIRDTVRVIHEVAPDLGAAPWEEMNGDMARVLRKFQSAARAELEVSDVGRPARPESGHRED